VFLAITLRVLLNALPMIEISSSNYKAMKSYIWQGRMQSASIVDVLSQGAGCSYLVFSALMASMSAFLTAIYVVLLLTERCPP